MGRMNMSDAVVTFVLRLTGLHALRSKCLSLCTCQDLNPPNPKHPQTRTKRKTADDPNTPRTMKKAKKPSMFRKTPLFEAYRRIARLPPLWQGSGTPSLR